MNAPAHMSSEDRAKQLGLVAHINPVAHAYRLERELTARTHWRRSFPTHEMLDDFLDGVELGVQIAGERE